MSWQTDPADVVVKNGLLWVDGNAFPLRNMTHAKMTRERPKRGLFFGIWALAVAVCADSLLMNTFLASSAMQGGAAQTTVLVSLVLATAMFVHAARRLSGRRLYVLTMEFWGGRHTTVASRHEAAVQRIYSSVTSAIGASELGGLRIGEAIFQTGNGTILKGVDVGGGIQFGDRIRQTGIINQSTINRQAPADQAADFQAMIAAVSAMRAHIDPSQRQMVDTALAEFGAEGADRAARESALTRVIGVAALIGDVGAPVVAAIRKVFEALS